uniref:Uncharacterized protein n=1 Tax=Candidatus Kentrum sp. MB TaxID=2138164 RepID=A0A450X111_9GAMM|nr:MAG: hypothetical protein BECKMB1821G_GA0114241_100354 [Candidatus Kentron sp. MB]VFK26570.1 MAG: hypothetical protein BECKMB1821I_GA0114274_100140 [Candidatus Kentron sp. MB]VFK74543.1 MAG: hypothetical protein BECKMB1821H_GA0114242_100634 [Candidatus Kentron sp. MB]
MSPILWRQYTGRCLHSVYCLTRVSPNLFINQAISLPPRKALPDSQERASRTTGTCFRHSPKPLPNQTDTAREPWTIASLPDFCLISPARHNQTGTGQASVSGIACARYRHRHLFPAMPTSVRLGPGFTEHRGRSHWTLGRGSLNIGAGFT